MGEAEDRHAEAVAELRSNLIGGGAIDDSIMEAASQRLQTHELYLIETDDYGRPPIDYVELRCACQDDLSLLGANGCVRRGDPGNGDYDGADVGKCPCDRSHPEGASHHRSHQQRDLMSNR